MSGETSRDVEHEAEGTRAHLAQTLEQLRTNLRPENVVDEVMSNARVGAGAVADSLAGVAKANPLPSLLIAAGAFVVMGVMSRNGAKRTKEPRSPTGLPRAALLEDPGAAGLNSRNSRLEVDPMMKSDIGADSGIGAIRSSVSAGAEGLRKRASEAYASTSSTLSHYVPRDRREVKSKLSNLLDDQPLILGAIGLAVGAALGAALPITETEDSVMGGTSHQLRRAASEAARHEVEGLRAVAGEAVDNIKKAAVDHGVSADNFNDLVRDVGSEARSAVNKVGASHDV